MGYPGTHGYDSQVYVFGTENDQDEDVYECHDCLLHNSKARPFPQFRTSDGLIDHLNEHVAAKHAVPKFVFENLLAMYPNGGEFHIDNMM